MCASEPSEHPRDTLRRRGLTARRRLGQNFLVSRAIMQRVADVACLGPGDVVLEIGAGLGRLTACLAARAGAVVGVEIDPGLCQVARERLAPLSNVSLICADFLASKHRINPCVTEAVLHAREGRGEGAGAGLKVVSNLPYVISSPAIINLLEWEAPVREIYVMLQAEVAQRLTAPAGTEAYGALTVLASYLSDVRKLFAAPPSAFWPRPGVSSSFVHVTPRPPACPARNYALFSEVVRNLFTSRRKTLARGLRVAYGQDRAQAILKGTQLDARRRPEGLRIEEFVALADALASLSSSA